MFSVGSLLVAVVFFGFGFAVRQRYPGKFPKLEALIDRAGSIYTKRK